MREKPSGAGPKEVKAPPRTGRAIRSSREPGMIRRPDAYEASALPSELSRRDGMPGVRPVSRSALGGVRTRGLPLRRRSLCPLSYKGVCSPPFDAPGRRGIAAAYVCTGCALMPGDLPCIVPRRNYDIRIQCLKGTCSSSELPGRPACSRP